MLLQEHITSFLQRPPMDPNEWHNILVEEDEKQKQQSEWKVKRSKPRKDRPQVPNKTPEEGSASGPSVDDIETDGDDDDNDNDGNVEDALTGDEVEAVIMVDHDSSGASSDSESR